MNHPIQLSLEFDRATSNSGPKSAEALAPERVLQLTPESVTGRAPERVIERVQTSVSRPEPPSPSRGVEIDPNGFLLRPPTDAQGRTLPIPYELKVSAKARQLYLRIEPGRGLQITVPKRYPKRAIPEVVEEQRAWITEALEDLDNKTPPLYRHWPPSQLDLQSCGALVDIQYRSVNSSEPRTKATAKWLSSTELLLDVDTDNRPLVAKVIAKALKGRAYDLLEPWIGACSARSQLHFKRLIVRGQRTVWGTYSSSGTLSLNYKLLFLEPDLVDYVLLHELAHIKHLDHSAAFWRFLDGLKPNAKKFDKELKEAGSQVPPWLELVDSA